jgi:cytochrome c oxidase accessory protein FixG
VLVDLARERFYFFFIEIWPQEIYYLTGLLILAALGLFLVTALFGRVWCGYACPQTVWTDLYILVERLIEGDRSARIRLAAGPWTASKVTKRMAKHAVWLLIAGVTGGAWVFYFADAPTLAAGLLDGTAPATAYIFIALLTLTTYSLAGLMREQVCTYMCPWPRIQAALTDAETLQVSYRVDRGEPRAPFRKGVDWSARGDCIDCNQCVAACPMGIDIRDGAQLECINCALCIDACDDVMARIARPKGLIAYDTDLNIDRRNHGERTRFRLLRARTIVYAAVIAVVAAVMLFSLAGRSTLGIDVIPDRNPLFVTLSDGSVRNSYTLKLMNRSDAPLRLELSVGAFAYDIVKIVGVETERLPAQMTVEPSKLRSLRVLITLHRDRLVQPSLPLTFTITRSDTGESADATTVFLSGEAR